MNARALGALLGFVALAGAYGCGEREPSGEAPAVAVWRSFDSGMELALKEKRPVVIDFYTSWCKWCTVMEEKTFSEPGISRYLAEHFVAIRINAESRSEKLTYKGEELAPIELTRRFGVRAFPSVAFLDTEGELITIVPGFIPPETFLPMLRYIKKECYKQRMSFEDFLKRQQECD
jgi:thioredoxin-related protein